MPRTRTKLFLFAEPPKASIWSRRPTAARTFSPGDEVLITAMEHHSNIVPWQILCDEKGAKLRVAPINDRGELLLDEFAKLLGPRTKLVAVTHVSNALGTINPVQRMVELAHAHKYSGAD